MSELAVFGFVAGAVTGVGAGAAAGGRAEAEEEEEEEVAAVVAVLLVAFDLSLRVVFEADALEEGLEAAP